MRSDHQVEPEYLLVPDFPLPCMPPGQEQKAVKGGQEGGCVNNKGGRPESFLNINSYCKLTF